MFSYIIYRKQIKKDKHYRYDVHYERLLKAQYNTFTIYKKQLKSLIAVRQINIVKKMF